MGSAANVRENEANAKVRHTASDATVLPSTTVGVFVETGGDVYLEMWGTEDNGATYNQSNVTVPANTWIGGNIRKILATSTTASGFVVDYFIL